MKRLTIFLFAIAMLAFAGCGDKGRMQNGQPMPEMIREAANWPPGSVPESTRVQQKTPKGAIHTGEYSLSAAQLAAIDQGLDELQAARSEDGFVEEAKSPHPFFRISTPKQPCVPSPESRTPSFVVNGGLFYDGTEWDQYNTKARYASPKTRHDGVLLYFEPDGTSVVFAAEMVFNTGSRSEGRQGWMYVCPDASIIVNAVRHGGDHIESVQWPYTEEYRTRPPYDGYQWANCSLLHSGPDTFHPLYPRNDRCVLASIRPGNELLIKTPPLVSDGLLKDLKADLPRLAIHPVK